MKKVARSSLFLLFYLLTTFKTFGAYIIRDAETESYIREILDEILIASDIKPSSVNLFLVKDDSINAFVSGGSNVFVNTGLIQMAKNYDVLQAVLAHEVGHIKASHIANFDNKIEKAVLEALFYSVSGALIALSGGAGSAIIAGLSIGANVAEKRVLSYSRAQELEADFYTFQVLTKLKASGEGVKHIFKRFEAMQEKQVEQSKINQYSTTHPFPSNRLAFFEEKFKSINYTPVFNKKLAEKHLFITAKLGGYFGNLNIEYSKEFFNNPSAKLYFEAFSALRLQNLAKAEDILKKMLAQDSKNPYLYEILGELEHKNFNYNSAIAYFSKSLDLKPNEFLFLFQIAQSYFENKDFETAIRHLEKASKIEPYNPQVPFKLAEIYSQKKENTIAKIYFIESEILRQNYQKAKILLKNLQQESPVLSKNFAIKVKDIEEFLKNK
jgi:predicted Zn-dependent protease